MKYDHILSLVSGITSKANQLIISELESKNITGLAPSHGAILYFLYQSETLSMMELAKKINRDKSTLTALIKKLVRLGYVEKNKDPYDSRVTLVKLTKKAWDVKPDFDEISDTLLERVYKDFKLKDKKEVIYALEKMLKNL